MNGKLALAVLTTAMRPGTDVSAVAHSATLRSGPMRLNLRSLPCPLPCPIRTITSWSDAVMDLLSRASAARTVRRVGALLARAWLFGEHDEVRRVVLELVAKDLGERVNPTAMLNGVLLLTRRALHQHRVTRALSRRRGRQRGHDERQREPRNEPSDLCRGTHVQSVPGGCDQDVLGTRVGRRDLECEQRRATSFLFAAELQQRFGDVGVGFGRIGRPERHRRLELEQRCRGLALREQPAAEPRVGGAVERIERRDEPEREILVIGGLGGLGQRRQTPRGGDVRVVVREELAQPTARARRIGLLIHCREQRARAVVARCLGRELRRSLERFARTRDVAGPHERAPERELAEKVARRVGRSRAQARQVGRIHLAAADRPSRREDPRIAGR